ncbi:MAG TPA: thiamine phosphate synthase [Longimicrobiales bacterium]
MRPVPRVHVVTDDAVLERSGFPDEARRVMEAGGAAVAFHVRGPGTSGRILHDVALGLRRIGRDTGTMLVVNDRVDVALALGLDGVHLGARSLPVDVALSLLPEGTRVGASTHGPEEAGAAEASGAHYLFVGAVFETPSHAGREGGGTALVRRVRARTTVPLVGIGGIEVGRVAEVLAAGAHGVALIRGVWQTPDPAEAVARLVEAVERAEPLDGAAPPPRATPDTPAG